MKKTILLLFISLATITSCSNKITNTIPKRINTTKPVLSEIAVVEVGESLIEKVKGNVWPAIIINTTINYTNSTVRNPIKINSGDLFIQKNQTKKHLYFTNIINERQVIAINKISGEVQLVIHEPTYNSYRLLPKFLSKDDYKETVAPMTNSGYFQQQFIYNGKMGTGVKFTYREFNNDLARPAFSQDLQYDLKEGAIVGFKGLRIEIIEALNTKIKFKVLSYFKD